jgi:hypothetical protein
MEAIFLRLIEELSSAVLILVLVLVALGYILVKIGEWKSTFHHLDEKVEKLGHLSNKVIELATKIDLIYLNTNPNAVIRAKSPLSLTEKGAQLIKEMKGKEIFEKYKEALIEKVQAQNSENAYDIQMAAMDVAKNELMNLLNPEEIDTLKNHAFNNGLIMEDVYSIFGIQLRDEILKKKAIPLAEVDKHAPAY